MHLAIILDDYLPQSRRVAPKMFHELACELFRQGHQVTVIIPNPMQKDYLVKDNIDNITIWRFKSGKLKDINKVKRAFNETLLSIYAWKAIKKQINENTFQGIIYHSPSIFIGPLIKKIRSICNCPTYLILRDLFPQWCIDAGFIRKGSLLEKYFRFFESYLYNQADTIGLMSERNIDIFNKYNKGYSTHLLRNWAKIKPTPRSDFYRKKLGLENKIIYFYGGNIGLAQDMVNLMKLARGMKGYKSAHFLFVGYGDQISLVEKLIIEWDLNNTTYLPSLNQEEFKKLLSEVDIGLFSLAKEHTSHNFPGKLLGYMVQSLPILGSVNNGNDLIPLINRYNAGYIHINGEDKKLLQSAISLYENKDIRLQIGRNGFKLLQDEFNVTNIASSILKKLGP